MVGHPHDIQHSNMVRPILVECESKPGTGKAACGMSASSEEHE
jgi:hypothetical protein